MPVGQQLYHNGPIWWARGNCALKPSSRAPSPRYVIGWVRDWGTVYICVADCTSNSGTGASADPVTAVTSVSNNCKGAAVKNVAVVTSANTSGRGTGVNNGGATASAVPANQFLYHIVVYSAANSLLMTWVYRQRHSS